MILFGYHTVMSPWGFLWILDYEKGKRRALTWAEVLRGRRFA